MRLYDDVALLNISITRNSSDVNLTIRIYEKYSGNWSSSKRLLPGSLVILSKDDFKTIEFFLVSDRDLREMA